MAAFEIFGIGSGLVQISAGLVGTLLDLCLPREDSNRLTPESGFVPEGTATRVCLRNPFANQSSQSLNSALILSIPRAALRVVGKYARLLLYLRSSATAPCARSRSLSFFCCWGLRSL